MKRSGVRFSTPLSILLLLVAAHVSCAAEVDPEGGAASVGKSGNDLKQAPPVTGKAGEEKKPVTKETLPKKKAEAAGENGPEKKSEVGSATGDSRLEDCDPSNRCVDDKSKFVACLRVPGKDSLDLSLLIQNKGKGSLNVNILAPEFVNLEQSTVLLKAKENKEVKVSVNEGGNDTTIVLKAGEGSCKLNFQNPASDSVKKSESATLPGHFSGLPIRSFVLVIVFATVLIGLAWSFIKFWRLRGQEGGSTKYQQLDVGLPISTGGKKDVSDSEGGGWDNSWGDDDWDVEEAPMTPSKPVSTPSAKGLASRKFNKEGWKD